MKKLSAKEAVKISGGRGIFPPKPPRPPRPNVKDFTEDLRQNLGRQ